MLAPSSRDRVHFNSPVRPSQRAATPVAPKLNTSPSWNSGVLAGPSPPLAAMRTNRAG